MEQPGTPANTLIRLKVPLRLTLAGLWSERLCRAFWPLWVLVISFVAALAFGVQDHLTLDAFWYAIVALAAGLVWAFWHGWRRFYRPTRSEAMARIDARLPGQPLAALNDVQALGQDDPISQAVWVAHRERMAARAADARPVAPNLRLADRDPYALRYIALTALLMALIFGSIWRVVTVSDLVPDGSNQAVATSAVWEGWAQPPGYTGKPTLYLGDQTGNVLNLPVGTLVKLRFYGAPGSFILSETVSSRTDAPPASDVVQEFSVRQSGKIGIKGTGGRAWQVTVVVDAPPRIVPKGNIGRDANGRFKQGYEATDDYGVARGQVAIALNLDAVDRRYGLVTAPDPVAPVVLDLTLPQRGDRRKVTETLIGDLSKTILSNLPVTMTFTVTDAAGQTETSETLNLILPGRRFFDPLAAALIEMRRDILWSQDNTPRTVQILRAITNHPEDMIRNEGAFLRLRTAMKRLESNAVTMDAAIRDEVTEELWKIALLVEEGDLTSARERLQRAQDRLAEAIRNGAAPEEIQELMNEMRQALDNYLDQLAEEARRRGEDQTTQNNGPSIQMNQDQLQQMLDELQKLMEEGKTAEAAELMDQLRQFMENMQVTQGEGGQGRTGPGQQAMRDLGETLRDQQGLSDDAFRDLQDGEEGNNGNSEAGKSLAERQKELRDNLNRLDRDGRLPGAGRENGKEGHQQLDHAGRAMEEAEKALRDGNLRDALDRQAEAMEAMREGVRNFGQALAEESRREGDNHADSEQGTNDSDRGQDPLGRQTGESARIGSDRNLLQGQDVYRRAEELLDEIRRRSGDLNRGEGERNYLKRLLDLF